LPFDPSDAATWHPIGGSSCWPPCCRNGWRRRARRNRHGKRVTLAELKAARAGPSRVARRPAMEENPTRSTGRQLARPRSQSPKQPLRSRRHRLWITGRGAQRHAHGLQDPTERDRHGSGDLRTAGGGGHDEGRVLGLLLDLQFRPVTSGNNHDLRSSAPVDE
jgi:hypothetical protein